jgi:hypothetical protein
MMELILNEDNARSQNVPHGYIVADLLINKLRTWANNTLAEDAFGDHICDFRQAL